MSPVLPHVAPQRTSTAHATCGMLQAWPPACRLPLLLPRHPMPAALPGEPDTPASSRGAALTRSLPAATLDYPARHGNYFACGKQHHCAGAGRAASEARHARPGMAFNQLRGDPRCAMVPGGDGDGDGDGGSPPHLPAHADGMLGGTQMHEMAFWGFLASFLTDLCLPGTSGSRGCVCPAWAWVSAGVCRGPSAAPLSCARCRRSLARAALACSGDALQREGKGFPLAWRRF